jgi:2-amino-4-hydroxy-6-hydroxymethyldihydropteridine diphosphokinase
MREVFVLLGSNRGDRMEYLDRAFQMISEFAGIILKKSSVYETAPWGFDDPISFLNQVIEIETNLHPNELLEHLLTIETKLGRIRPFSACGCSIQPPPERPAQMNPDNQDTEFHYQGRTIDLDILFYGDKLVFTDDLMVPHPRLHERNFTLIPLNEIAPGMVHPLLKKSISSLLKECRDQTKVIAFYH